MINILLEGFDLSAPWLMSELKKCIKPGSRVAVVALSFRDAQARNADDWSALYSREGGMYYGGIAGAFADYGIAEDDISFINYFEDTHDQAAKIEAADILYFPGGLPDRMVQRIDEMGLRDVIMRHEGIVMGFSAGAMLQLKEYHISPDKDYPEFVYRDGLGWLDGFYVEVHYENNEEQNAAIKRVLKERKRTVYATEFMNGAIIVEDGNIRLLGDVKVFEPNEYQ